MASGSIEMRPLVHGPTMRVAPGLTGWRAGHDATWQPGETRLHSPAARTACPEYGCVGREIGVVVNKSE